MNTSNETSLELFGRILLKHSWNHIGASGHRHHHQNPEEQKEQRGHKLSRSLGWTLGDSQLVPVNSSEQAELLSARPIANEESCTQAR